MDSYANDLFKNKLNNLAKDHGIKLEFLIKELYNLHYKLEEEGHKKNRSDGECLNVKQGQKRKRGRPKKK